RSDRHARGTHWSDFAAMWGKSINKSHRDLELAEFCPQYETVELWFDTDPNAQLQLIWLLDYFRSHPEAIAKLKLRFVDQEMTELDRLDKWQPPAFNVTERELATASAAWRAYQATTPEACFELLGQDLSALPLLRPALIDLLKELPSSSTGLGATEMRMLELISEGNAFPADVFPGHEKRNRRRVFGYWEIGSLLDGLAHCPAPVVSGLDEGPFTLEMHDDRGRHARYKQSKLKLTALGEAILAGTEDFTQHNPFHRWWGGTELTDDRLWRWDPVKQALVEP
ncbi:MAG: hypothetical protein ACRD5Z_01595, partial [Bryobacteraceae bacterium]